MLKKILVAAGIITLAIPLLASAGSCPNLVRNLAFGSRGSDVIQLQQYLISQNLLASDSATGYFGRLTEAAVKKFQCQQGIACSGSASTNGYGAAGPRTRAAIARQCSTQNIIPVTISPPTSTCPQITAPQCDGTLIADGTDSNGCSIGYHCKNKSTACADYARPECPNGTLVSNGTNANGCSLGYYCSTTAVSCTPLSPQTQTLACPAGQTGSITQSRTSSCPGPVWGSWATTMNTCVVPQKTVLSGALDPIDWMTTNKGTGYVRGYFETWNGNTWVSGTGGVAQPFKMFADTAASQIYWRKDMPAETQRGDGKDYEFSGEIYTFDASSVRLRSESMYFFPCPALGRCDPTGQAWDIRADKFRLFVDGTGPLDTTEGLFFMPRPVWNGWSHGPYPLATYYCNSFLEFHQSTCSLYQKSDQWGWVSVEAYHNYDIFNADGDQVVVTPDGTPQQRIYDVLIVSQHQQVSDVNECVIPGHACGVARERFFYGKIGNDKYGFIRWDSAKNVNGHYVLDARTVGYAWDTSYNPQFSEMQARGAEER